MRLTHTARGRPCDRQPRQERKDVQPARPSRVAALVGRLSKGLSSTIWYVPSSTPGVSRLILKLDPRLAGGPPRHHSVSEFGDARSFSGSNLQNFYASQRHQPSRGANEAEQVMQAKRRMAAQRERELRNYHQEQQYNRSRPPSSV
jgi:hypothetical protein